LPTAAQAISHYHQPGFNWSTVNRVVIVPVYNQSQYPTATFEIRESLAAELQKLGRFEVVAPEPGYPDTLSRVIHVNGQFDEAEMLAVGHEFSADVVIHVAITQYAPYTRPRLGLIVQAVAPREAKVIASVDGVWDASMADTATRARDYFRTPRPTRLQQYLHGPPTATDGYADELALESPKLFQQFVCTELAQALIPEPSR
jgi:hypothetical protein